MGAQEYTCEEDMGSNQGKLQESISEVTALNSAALEGGDMPDRVLLAPWGPVESTSGSFVVDEESGRLVAESFTEHGTDLPIDYEHQTLGGVYSSPDGRAPAAGWVKGVEAEPGVGILARIEWTDPGRELVSSKQYRYLSPVAMIRKSDRKLVGIHSAALTNKPAIVGMKPIVNREQAPESGEPLGPIDDLRNAMKMAPEASSEEIVVAANERLVHLQREAADRHIKGRLREATESGRLVASQRDWAGRLIRRDEELFEEWLATAPVVVARGMTPAPGTVSGDVRSKAAESRARAEFKVSPLLSALTTEEAYVAEAVRSVEA